MADIYQVSFQGYTSLCGPGREILCILRAKNKDTNT